MMNIKIYDSYKTKKRIALANQLTESPRSEIFYDFSLLQGKDDIEPDAMEAIKKDLMKHHTAGASWIDQPIPFMVSPDEYTNYYCSIETAYTRVFKKNGERMMIIINVTSMKIEKWERKSIYDRDYSFAERFEYKSEYAPGEYPDMEIA